MRSFELSTRSYLFVLVAAILLPVAAFAGYVLARYAEGERSRVQAEAIHTAERIAAAVDRELEGLESALQALSTGRSFGERAFNRFYERAAEIRRVSKAEIILKDATGQQLLNTRVPFGTALPRSLQEHEQRALSLGRPQVSGLFTGSFTGSEVISVTVPLRRDDREIDLLTIAVDPARFGEVLTAQSLPDGWNAAILDRAFRTIGSSGEGSRSAAEPLRARTAGPSTLRAEAHPQLAPTWSVRVDVPIEIAQAPVRDAVLPLLGGGALTLVLSLGVAGWMGTRGARAMRDLARAADDLGASRLVGAPETPVREMNLVAGALAQASEALAAREIARRRAEEAREAETARLAESEARLRSLADNLPAGLAYQIATAQDGSPQRFAYMSQSCERVIGLPAARAQADPKSLYDIIAPESREAFYAAEAHAVATRGTLDVEVAFRRADTGETRWARIVSAPRPGPDGSTVWDGLFIDVTQSHEAQRALRDRQTELSRVQRIGGVAGVDVDLRRGFRNARSPEYLLLHGLPPGAADEAHEDWVARIHPDDRGTDAHFRAVVQSGSRDYEAEYRIIRPSDGAVRWISAKAEIERDAGGAPLRLVGAHIDVTDRKRAEEELRRLNEHLEAEIERRTAQLAQLQKLEAIGQLTGGVAHDFNNLLMAVLGSLELLAKRLGDDPRAKRLLDNAVQGAQRGASLTQRLLAFARQQDLAPTAVEVSQLVHEMLDLLRRSLGPQVELELRFPRTLPPARVDANQLELAVLNLAVNGRDAMPGGGRILVSARAERLGHPEHGLAPGDYVVVSIEDTGSGMSEDTLRRATEPFFTTKGVGKGTGLGLSMVHGLAEQSGGKLLLRSRLGIGTTAELWLPRAEEAVPAQPPAEEKRHADPTPSRTLLVVDDDPLVLAGTADLLEDLGYRVVEASSGRQALEILAAGARIEFVLTDYAMPGMTGLALIEAIRQTHPDMPTLLATGYAEAPDLTDVPRIAKPYSQSALREAVNEALSGGARRAGNVVAFGQR